MVKMISHLKCVFVWKPWKPALLSALLQRLKKTTLDTSFLFVLRPHLSPHPPCLNTDSPLSLNSFRSLSPAYLHPVITLRLSFCPLSTSWRGRTVRAAPSTACAATAAPTRTLPATRPPSCRVRLSLRLLLLPPSLCRSYPLRTPRTGPSPSRRSLTPSRSGPSPGACTRADVSRTEPHQVDRSIQSGGRERGGGP